MGFCWRVYSDLKVLEMIWEKGCIFPRHQIQACGLKSIWGWTQNVELREAINEDDMRSWIG